MSAFTTVTVKISKTNIKRLTARKKIGEKKLERFNLSAKISDQCVEGPKFLSLQEYSANPEPMFSTVLKLKK